MRFMKLFTKNALPLLEEKLSIEDLDNSLNLLKSTTLEVSEAAINAAETLQALKDTEFRFFNTIDAVSDVIMIKDSSNRWKTLNDEAQRVFGISYPQWIGKTNDEIVLEMQHLRDCLLRCNGTDEVAWETKGPIRTTEEISVEGITHIFDFVKTPIFDKNGERKELIIIGRDVTELRNKDKRMNACFAALNYASDAIAILDNTFHVVFSNDSFNQTFSHDDLSCKHLKDTIDDFPKFFTMAKSVVKNKPWKGYYKEFTVNVMPVMNGSPTPVHYICTFKRNAAQIQSAAS